MIAEIGLSALWLASSLALLQLLLALGVGGQPTAKAARGLALAQGVLTFLSFAALIILFLRTDLSVELVAANSHSAKPWLY